MNTKTARALAREVTGANPVRASLLLLVILLLIFVTVVWAATTELDRVTRADGRIVPSGEVQVIQPSEPGVIATIHAQEGDLVEYGDALVTLDDTQIEGELGQAKTRVVALELRIARLKAEIANEAFEPLDLVRPQNAALVSSEKALYAARRTAFEDEISVLMRQRRQREQSVVEAETRVVTARQTLQLINDELEVMRPLVDDGVEPRTTMIGLLGRIAEAEGRLSEARATLGSAEASVLEIDDRVVSERSQIKANALEELARAEAELAEVLVRLPGLETRLTRSVLVSPVHGIVNRVLQTTVGALARAGEPIVEIVPVEDTLVVEAYLRPEDVAFVHVGQGVRVSLTAYDASRYGALDGQIRRVGADAVVRPDRDERAFIVEIETVGSLTDADDNTVQILPGMVAQVDILSGKRTVLQYLTEPVVRVKDSALRE